MISPEEFFSDGITMEKQKPTYGYPEGTQEPLIRKDEDDPLQSEIDSQPQNLLRNDEIKPTAKKPAEKKPQSALRDQDQRKNNRSHESDCCKHCFTEVLISVCECLCECFCNMLENAGDD